MVFRKGIGEGMEINWNEITGEMLTAVLKVILPVCVALILKWGAELWLKVKASKPDLAEILSYAARTAVFAAEQVFGSGHGEEKRSYAIEFMQNYLAERGLNINVDVIVSSIESAVWCYLNQWKSQMPEPEGGQEE